MGNGVQSAAVLAAALVINQGKYRNRVCSHPDSFSQYLPLISDNDERQLS